MEIAQIFDVYQEGISTFRALVTEKGVINLSVLVESGELQFVEIDFENEVENILFDDIISYY